MNWLTEGIVVEIVGGLIFAALTFFFGRYYERQKKIQQFYDGITPTLKMIWQNADRLECQQNPFSAL